MKSTCGVMVVAVDAARQRDVFAAVETASLGVVVLPSIAAARDALRQQSPQLIIVEAGEESAGEAKALYRTVHEEQIALLAITADPAIIGDACDDWIAPERCGPELILRSARLLRQPTAATPLADPRFMALIVHDLRTPLNVFTLTIRALSQSVKSPSPDFEEDLSFLLENVRQIERMLSQLGDYTRLIETRSNPSTVEFQTHRFLADFLEEKQAKRTIEFKEVRLEILPETPEVVELDPTRVRVALHHALANAATAQPETPIFLRSGGSVAEWTLEILLDKPTPATVNSTQLHPGFFERLIGSNTERRGFDLAIAAHVAESFGGSARLDVEPGARSTIRLSFPTRPVATA